MYLLYHPYSMGLTLISLVATTLMIFSKKKENRILSVIILLISIFPIFNFVLNGFLYINGKSLIPFIPLVLLNTADFLELIFSKLNKKVKIVLITYIMISASIVCFKCNLSEDLITPDTIEDSFYQYYSDDTLYRTNTSLIDKTYINKVRSPSEYKTTMYSSTFNKNYYDAYNDLFYNPKPNRNKFYMNSSTNILFQMYMGEKYIISREEYPNDMYQKVFSKDDIFVYQNDYVLPIGYATTRNINIKDFEDLSYPENVVNMLGNSVTSDETNIELIKIDNVKPSYTLHEKQNIEYTKIAEDGYLVEALENARITLEMDIELKNKLLFIGFDLEEQTYDLSIQINDVKNKLTSKNARYKNGHTYFNFILFDNLLNIQFDKGEYMIHHINISVIDLDYLKNVKNNVDHFIIDKDRTKGDSIVGKIDVKEENSYFVISIPYDKGFSILVDGKKMNYQKVNKAFIGFKITKGNHDIEITYHAPYQKMGEILSLTGIIFLLILCGFKENKPMVDCQKINRVVK